MGEVPLDQVGQRQHVVAEEQDDALARRAPAGVARRRHALPLPRHDPRAVARHALRSRRVAVLRVHADHDLERVRRLPLQPVQDPPQQRRPLVRGDDDAEAVHRVVRVRSRACWSTTPTREREELRRYLGDAYDEDRLRGHAQGMLAEFEAAPDEATLYRTSRGVPLRPDGVRDERDEAAVPRGAHEADPARRARARLRLRHRRGRAAADGGWLPRLVRRLRQPEHALPALAAARARDRRARLRPRPGAAARRARRRLRLRRDRARRRPARVPARARGHRPAGVRQLPARGRRLRRSTAGCRSRASSRTPPAGGCATTAATTAARTSSSTAHDRRRRRHLPRPRAHRGVPRVPARRRGARGRQRGDRGLRAVHVPGRARCTSRARTSASAARSTSSPSGRSRSGWRAPTTTSCSSPARSTRCSRPRARTPARSRRG